MNFDDLFEAIAAEFNAAFIRSGQGVRPDEKGGPREEQLRRFLAEWLPPQYGLTNGYVINKTRKISRQCDVIIFDQFSCPKFLLDRVTDLRLVPYSDFYGMIEVKSTLGMTELEDALSKIQAIDKLYDEIRNRYAVDKDYDEFDFQAIEIDELGQRVSYVEDRHWRTFRARMKKSTIPRTLPFTIIFSYKLNKNLSLEKLDEYLNNSSHLPNAVVVLDTGILVQLNQQTLTRYKSLKSGRPVGSYSFHVDWLDELDSRSKRARRGMTVSKYIIESSIDSKSNLMLFYGFLLDLLKGQYLTEYNYMDLIAAWRKSER